MSIRGSDRSNRWIREEDMMDRKVVLVVVGGTFAPMTQQVSDKYAEAECLFSISQKSLKSKEKP